MATPYAGLILPPALTPQGLGEMRNALAIQVYRLRAPLETSTRAAQDGDLKVGNRQEGDLKE